MRSGLEKPGALPLLALVVFSLLTLVPSLSSIYNLKLADLNFYPGGARRMSLFPLSASFNLLTKLPMQKYLFSKTACPKYQQRTH
jgi:hypothetical protein